MVLNVTFNNISLIRGGQFYKWWEPEYPEKPICKGKSMDLAISGCLLCSNGSQSLKCEYHPTFKSDFDTGKMYVYACVFNTALVIYT
jgi:hypothetical protein